MPPNAHVGGIRSRGIVVDNAVLDDNNVDPSTESTLRSLKGLKGNEIAIEEKSKTELLESEIKQELLDLIKANNPAFFERLVVDLLVAMGYGGSHQDAAQAIGKTNDGGIDGIISEDRLGLDKIYIQAKRWQGTVGRPELQAFYGALAGQKAKRGVFITTSGFTSQAADFARSVEGIVLVDGSRLVNLMMDHEVGVTSRLLKLPKLDSDYFDEE